MTLSKSISTSGDPGTAGRASDIILGGGLELQFTEIVRVYAVEAFELAGNGLCIESVKDLTWEPAKLTVSIYSSKYIHNEQVVYTYAY
jgi:hypothetical protein